MRHSFYASDVKLDDALIKLVLREMQETQDQVQKVRRAFEDAQRSDRQADLSFLNDVIKFVLGLVTVPVMKSGASNGDEHERSDEVHDHFNERLFVISTAEAEGDKNYAGVYEEPDEDARRDDLRVRVLVLVQIPCPANAQKFPLVSRSVQDQDNKIEDQII